MEQWQKRLFIVICNQCRAMCNSVYCNLLVKPLFRPAVRWPWVCCKVISGATSAPAVTPCEMCFRHRRSAAICSAGHLSTAKCQLQYCAVILPLWSVLCRSVQMKKSNDRFVLWKITSRNTKISKFRFCRSNLFIFSNAHDFNKHTVNMMMYRLDTNVCSI